MQQAAGIDEIAFLDIMSYDSIPIDHIGTFGIGESISVSENGILELVSQSMG